MTNGEPTTDDVPAQIAEELLRIHRESHGKGAQRADVVVCEDVVCCVLDEVELLPNEEFMADAGRAETVVDIRLNYQHANETTLRAAVERATGRRVVEVFRPGPHMEAPLPDLEAGEEP